VAQLLDVFGFFSVLLRGLTLLFQSLVMGGLVFSLFVLSPASHLIPHGLESAQKSCRWLLGSSALALAATQFIYVLIDSAILMQTAELRLHEVAGANFFLAGAVAAIAGSFIAWMVLYKGKLSLAAIGLPVLVILSASLMTSHAAARMESRLILAFFTFVHQGATGAWIGGLPYLVITLGRCTIEPARLVCRKFSRLAFVSVLMIATAGLGLSIFYIRTPDALYGTSYGVMVVSKIVMLGMLLILGALNFFAVRGLDSAAPGLLLRLRRFAEVEVGIGFTVILAAASLTSQPPAVDLTADRVTASQIAERMTPRWPRMRSPAVSELSPATPLSAEESEAPGFQRLQSFVPGQSYSPNTPADIAWSEYNHHWAGIVVLAAGFLATGASFSKWRWTRHWPLAFIGLAVFLFLRADAENWPLGPRGFWESFLAAEVLQHRIFVLLIVVFAVFEWGIQTGRLSSQRAAMVFPMVCALGGVLLLAHTHSLGNVKEELLAELSHIPLGLAAILAGWSRWLELRLPDKNRFIPAKIWPICLVLVGIILMLYRES
jgi:putative copper resistance protein D